MVLRLLCRFCKAGVYQFCLQSESRRQVSLVGESRVRRANPAVVRLAVVFAGALLWLVMGCSLVGEFGEGTSVPSDCQRESGTAIFGLDQNGGSMSFIYNVSAVDPLAFCETKHAVITNVTNQSERLSLAHGGPGSQFIILDGGTSTSIFNGQLVEGNWTAQWAGAAGTPPSQVTIKVDWTRP